MGDGSTVVGGMSETLVSAFQTGFNAVSADVTSILGVAIPIAVGIAGVIFVARKAMGWFKSMAK